MTDRVRLRPLTPADASEMARVLSDPSLYEFIGGEPPTKEQLQRQYTVQARGHSASGDERWINDLVILETTGETVGYVQATAPAPAGPAEVVWVIGAPWHGRGYATEATALLASELASLGIRELVAHIHPDHTASAAVARRLGMHPTQEVVDGEVRWEGSVQVAAGGR